MHMRSKYSAPAYPHSRGWGLGTRLQSARLKTGIFQCSAFTYSIENLGEAWVVDHTRLVVHINTTFQLEVMLATGIVTPQRNFLGVEPIS